MVDTAAQPEQKILNAGPDTFLVNYKFVDEQGLLNGASLPEPVAELLDEWQKQARREHEPIPTDLVFSYVVGETRSAQTLLMRSHGTSMWSWLLYCDDVTVSFAHGTVNKGLFCQARFSSHLLHTIGPEQAMIELEAMLYSFLGDVFHKQCSELHLCVDIQGFDFSRLSLIGEQLPFVSRVTAIRDRPVPPTEEEQEGGLSVQAIRKLEAQIEQEKAALEQEERFHLASVLTTHRRIATIDFGSHASEISAQIYNKTAEIKKHRKEWFFDIWRANGWDGTSEVWRVEFRMRRDFFRRYELNEAFEVLGCLRLLWQYATEQWLRFVDLDAERGANVSRLPTHPIWEMIQRAYDAYEQVVTRDPEGERQARLKHIVQEKPLETLKQAAALSLHEGLAEELEAVDFLSVEELVGLCGDRPVPSFARSRLSVALLSQLASKPLATRLRENLFAIEQSLRDEPVEVLRELAQEELAKLSPVQVEMVLDTLSPASFEVVRTSLVKRERQMAKLKACIAGGIGYLRSAVALMPLDELPSYLGPGTPGSRTLPDLLASMVWFYGKALDYDKKKGRVHLEEVHKKRLVYGLVTAQQLEEERQLYGVDLSKEDWQAIDLARDLLRS